MGLKEKLISLALALPLALMVSLVSLLYLTKKNKANALEIIGWGETICLNCNKQSNSTNSTTLYHKPQQKKTNEFKPPELPYCKIKRADWEGVVIDYWDKNGEKHTYRWGVNQPHWYSGGASVELVYQYREQDDGTRDYEGLDECIIRAGKKVLYDKYIGGIGHLYIEEMDGYIFDQVTLIYSTR